MEDINRNNKNLKNIQNSNINSQSYSAHYKKIKYEKVKSFYFLIFSNY